jgi:hypothetical protein
LKWKFWRRRPEPAANPTMSFSLTPDGTVVATGSFPDLGPRNVQEGHWFGKLAFLLHTGTMLPAFQKALATPGNGAFTQAALAHLNQLVDEKSRADAAPLVDPEEAFQCGKPYTGKPND